MVGSIKSFLLSAILLFSSCHVHSLELLLWHSFDGPLGKEFVRIIEAFNQRPDIKAANIQIIPKYKGDYETVLNLGMESLHTGKAPHIIQIYEMGSLVMQSDPKNYIALNELSDSPSSQLRSDRFVPALQDYYKNRHCEGMCSLPFAASSIVTFYNVDGIRRLGAPLDEFPNTWEGFEALALKLKAKGAKKVLASGWLSSHHLEQLGAWHNQAVASQGNGIDGDAPKLRVNSTFFRHHLRKLSEWFQNGIFSLASADQAERAFANGDVLILTQNANRLPHLEELVGDKFEIGVAPLFYWKKYVSSPQNTLAGGSSLWVLPGHSKEEYAAIQEFFEYLVSVDVQADWHRSTCYLPVILGVKEKLEKENYYSSTLHGKTSKVAMDSFLKNTPQEYSRGILLPDFPKIRAVVVQEMKQAIKRKKTPKEALDQINRLGNRIMCGLGGYECDEAKAS